MISYLLIGVGFYLGLCLARPESFKGATIGGVIRGAVFGVFTWPVAAVAVYMIHRVENNYKPETNMPPGDML